MSKIDPSFKKRWLTALKTGHYPKGVTRLRNKSGQFCCLGVAADLVDESYGTWRAPDNENPNCYAYVSSDPREKPILGFLPDSVLKAIGLSHDDGEELYRLNDNNSTFGPVITYIEENL